MSSTTTKNLSLHTWEPNDPIRRQEFNENFQKIDETLAHPGNCRIVYGSYTGTGVHTTTNPTRLDLTALGAPPKLVCVVSASGGDHLYLVRGMTSQTGNFASTYSDRYVSVTWTDTGVSWTNHYSAHYQLNSKNQPYFYVAIG